MGVIIKDCRLLTIKNPKTIYFDFPRDFQNSLKHEINYIIKHM